MRFKLRITAISIAFPVVQMRSIEQYKTIFGILKPSVSGGG